MGLEVFQAFLEVLFLLFDGDSDRRPPTLNRVIDPIGRAGGRHSHVSETISN